MEISLDWRVHLGLPHHRSAAQPSAVRLVCPRRRASRDCARPRPDLRSDRGSGAAARGVPAPRRDPRRRARAVRRWLAAVSPADFAKPADP